MNVFGEENDGFTDLFKDIVFMVRLLTQNGLWAAR